MTRARHLSLAVLLLAPAALGGCMTPHAKPQVSQAVLETRAREHGGAGPSCTQVPLSEVSPVTVGFAFDAATLPDAADLPLAAALPWLACHPAAVVVIKPDSDPQGVVADQDKLARGRGQAVQGYLIEKGVAAARIQVLARGAAEPAGEHLLILAEGRRW